MLAYPIEIACDGDTFLITCPDLPEVTTFAECEDDIEKYARLAIEEALAARIYEGEIIPMPSGGKRMVRLPTSMVSKAALYNEMRLRGVTRAELCRRLGWKRESVDRLFRLDHASKLEQLEAAFAALGLEMDVAIRQAA
jgi:antitoxin HicB